jgi:hypothetical protein
MAGTIVGMGMISTDILPIGSVDNIDPSMVENISSETIFVNTHGLNKSDQDRDFGMKSNSRASSRTSTTEPIDDICDGEEGENRVIAAAAEAIVEKSEEALQSSEVVPARRHTVGSCETTTSKRFGFGTITIREYGRVLGDNVTVMGPPIGLSWQHQDEIVYDLVEYDEACKETRRTQSELKMPMKHRETILKEGGYSRQEIQEAVKRSNIARNQRKRTVETLSLQPLQESFEKIIRFGKKPLKKRDSLRNMDTRNSI